MKNYYIDLDSSTIKVYCFETELKLIKEHSIYFENDYDAEKVFNEISLEKLYQLMPTNPKWMDGAIIPVVLFRMANVN